jgi:hypothetical protein
VALSVSCSRMLNENNPPEPFSIQLSYLAVWCGSLERSVGQGDERVIAEEVGGLLLHDSQHLEGEQANLGLGVATGPHLDEMAQRPRVGRVENLRLRGIGQNTASGLTGHLAPQRAIRLVLELIRQSFDELYISLVSMGDGDASDGV